ncbi:MAG: hypothetical protein ACQSGP_18675 [Frankia sp.]
MKAEADSVELVFRLGRSYAQSSKREVLLIGDHLLAGVPIQHPVVQARKHSSAAMTT